MQDNEFSYGGIESGKFNITYGTERHSMLPQKRKYTQEVIGMDGVIDFDIEGYDVRVITIPIYYEGNYEQLRADREEIIAWLYNNGKPKKLIFGNNVDRYYFAKVYAALDFENSTDKHIGDIQFECNPPWQYLLDGTVINPSYTLWLNCDTDTNQFVKEFSNNGVMQFVNVGLPNKPLIKIIGNIPSGITLTYGEQKLKINQGLCFDGIAVDCNRETVTRLSDSKSLYEFIDEDCDDFFEFASGKISLGISAENLEEYPNSITVIVEMQITQGG